MAYFAAANELQALWPVQQLRLELNQAFEQLNLVTGYLHNEKNYSAYLQGELERLQADHHELSQKFELMNISLEWQKECEWQARCALHKKEEELSALQQNGKWRFQRRCIQKLDENPTCNGGSLHEFSAQVVRTKKQGENFSSGKLVEEEVAATVSKKRLDRPQGRRSVDSISSWPPDKHNLELGDLGEKEEFEAHSQVLPVGQDQKTTLLPEGLWQNMLEFLCVAEVVKMETRAVSRFFSGSKIWLAHLLKLMDLDSLPQCADGTTHPAYEWSRHYDSWNNGKMDRAMEIERNASEGFQGCRCFLNGIAMWHASYPEMMQPFLTTVIQCVSSRNPVLSSAGRRMWGEVAQSVPGLGRTASGALNLLSTKGPDHTHYFAIQLLFTCIGAYYFSKGYIAELVRNVRSFMSWKVKMDLGYAQIFGILNAAFTEESDRRLAIRYYNAMINAERKSQEEEAAAKEQLLLDMLTDSG